MLNKKPIIFINPLSFSFKYLHILNNSNVDVIHPFWNAMVGTTHHKDTVFNKSVLVIVCTFLLNFSTSSNTIFSPSAGETTLCSSNDKGAKIGTPCFSLAVGFCPTGNCHPLWWTCWKYPIIFPISLTAFFFLFFFEYVHRKNSNSFQKNQTMLPSNQLNDWQFVGIRGRNCWECLSAKAYPSI